VSLSALGVAAAVRPSVLQCTWAVFLPTPPSRVHTTITTGYLKREAHNGPRARVWAASRDCHDGQRVFPTSHISLFRSDTVPPCPRCSRSRRLANVARVSAASHAEQQFPAPRPTAEQAPPPPPHAASQTLVCRILDRCLASHLTGGSCPLSCRLTASSIISSTARSACGAWRRFAESKQSFRRSNNPATAPVSNLELRPSS
jgi:hypothetical protein